MVKTLRTIKVATVRIKITQAMIDSNHHCSQACPFYDALIPFLQDGVSVHVDANSISYYKDRGTKRVGCVGNVDEVIQWIRTYDLDNENVKPGSFLVRIPVECLK